MKHLTTTEYLTSVHNFQQSPEWKFLGNRPAVIDFYADWCGPCRMVGPVLEKLSNEFTNVDFYKVDVDNEPDVSTANKVTSIPTLLFISSNGTVSRFSGALPEKALREKIAALV